MYGVALRHSRAIDPPGPALHDRVMAEGGSEAGRRRRKRLALAWLAILAGLTLLYWLADIGPIAWLATWFAVSTGQLFENYIFFLLLVPALPTLWFLVPPADEASKGKGRRNEWARDEIRLAAVIMLALAGVSLTVSAVCLVRMLQLPDSRGPVAKPSGSLADMAAARQRVVLTGAPVEGAEASFVQAGKNQSSRWAYAGFRPGARRGTAEVRPPTGTPVDLFVERRLNNVPNSPGYVPPAQEEMTGFLVEDGLPDHARIVLERQGLTIARPHYLLKTGEEGLREPWLVPLFLGLLFGFIFGLIGLALLVKAAADRTPARRTRG